MRRSRIALAVAGALAMAAPALAQAPVSAGFTYQGRLKDALEPVTGPSDLTFTLWDAPGVGTPPVGGIQIGGPDNNPGTQVTDGLFTVQLNDASQFGPSAFTGDARWLQVSVNGTVLGPRQPLTAAPYALYSLNGPGSGLWEASGNNISNTNTGFVGVNRSSAVSAAEYFGIQAEVAAGYGGMYVRTDGASALPFYGYKAGPSGETAWSYLDGASGDWRLNVDGDRLTVTDTGDVGIGVTSPGARLAVESLTTSSANNTARFSAPNIGPNTSHIHYGTNGDWYLRSADAAGKVILQDTGGNVGIGTTSPSAKLQVNAADNGNASAYSFAVSGQSFDPQGYGGSFAGPGFLGAGRALLVWGDSHLLGPVGIATTTIPAGVKLAVAGKVLCEELEVQLEADWPDYVFADKYDLMSLEQVDAYVREHKHLPGVPSAAEIKADGVNVGEMHATLLRKLEELTLHMIELDREVTELRAENETLRSGLGTPKDGGR